MIQVDEGPVEESKQSDPDGPASWAGTHISDSQTAAACRQDAPVRLRLVLGYDGAGFCGWARQPGLRSIQAELEAALSDVLWSGTARGSRTALLVSCAGRTDAGVHARGQVCHVDLPPRWAGVAIDLVRLRDQLHGRLPWDIRVGRVDLAPLGFDARWSALWRRYVYRVADPAGGFDPLLRGWVLWQRRELDVAAMSAAVRPFLGEHDFAAFCKQREGASSVRTILDLNWERTPDGLVEMSIRADAFCHSMVRSLVGAFLAVGLRRWPAERPAQLLHHGRRIPGAAVAPAHGLCLEQVGYPADELLGEQALRAKRWRGR